MTAVSLRSKTAKDLAQLAKKEGVAGWHSMRKDELVRALVKIGRRKAARARRESAKARTNGAHCNKNGSHEVPANSKTSKRLRKLQSAQELLKYLSNAKHNKAHKDRLVVMVRGPYWLHVCWELRRDSVQRAAAAMGQHWHSARPVLRLLAVKDNGTTRTTERVLRDIEVHGGVNNWYIDVPDPPGTFQVDIGYLAENGQYHSLARSNIVSTPAPSSSDTIDENWDEVASNCDKIFAMSGGYDPNGAAGDLRELFEERLRRPMGSPIVTRYGLGADHVNGRKGFDFEVDAELIIYGTTSPDAHVAIKGQPIELREDGSFTVRMSMPDRRQVIPVVANRADGVEQRTTVIAVDRNTKVMETLIRDPEDQHA